MKIKMMRIFTLMLAFIMMTAVFAACGNKAAQQTETTAATQQEDINKGFPLTVKDFSGTEMTLEKAPVKIVSLTHGTDEMLIGLIDTGRIISVTTYALDPGVSNVVEEAKKIPNTFTSEESEKIIAAQPDLVFVDTWADAGFIKNLREAGIIVYQFDTPSNIDQQKQVIAEIAHVVGADKKGEELVTWMDEKLKAVEEKLKNLKEEDKLAILDYSEMGTTSGKNTNTDDLLTRAGLINVAARAGLDGWPQVNKESVVEWNPDLILLPSWYYNQELTIDSLKNNLKNDKSLADVNAIKNDAFITVPYSHMGSISQFSVLAVEDLAKAAYPELFK